MPASRNAITRKLRRRKSPKSPGTRYPKTGAMSRQQRRRKARRLRISGMTVLALLLCAPAAGAQELAPGLEISPDSNTTRLYPQVAPAPSLRFTLGEVIGMRDIQGGKIVPGLPQLNALDIGAGNGQQPGRLTLGADVSAEVRFTAVRPGERPTRIATMTPDGTFFHAPVHFDAPPDQRPTDGSDPVPLEVIAALARRSAKQAVRRHLRRHHRTGGRG